MVVEYVIQQRHNSLKLWPDNKQWKNWSLPSKLTAIATLIGILSFCFYITEKSFDIFKWASKEVPIPEINIDLDFPYERLDGTIKQNNRNPELTVTNRGPITLSPITVDVDMFVLNPSLDTIYSGTQLKQRTHGHLLFESDFQPGQSISTSLVGIKGWVKPVVYYVRINMLISEEKKMPLLALLFLVDQNNISGEGGKLEKEKEVRIKKSIQTFLSNVDLKKKVTFYAPLDGVWVPHTEPGVEMRLNEDSSLTIK